MSKADVLGAGSSFQQARPVSSRRAAIEAATAAPTTAAPPPVELPVGVISLNPDNPRTDLGDLTDLGNSLRDHGQKTAISIMSRFAYLEGNPGREQDLEPDTRYVVIEGNSRLAASREAGLATIKVMLDDDLGSNPDEILESALVANVHRNDLDPLDEARALDQLMKVHKTQEALAARLHRSQGWVSQRLALLGLTPELQRRLEAGEESAELLRSVGRKKPEEQELHLARLKEKKAADEAARKAPRKAGPSSGAADYYAVMKPKTAEGKSAAGAEQQQTASAEGGWPDVPPSSGGQKLPEQRPDGTAANTAPAAAAAQGSASPLAATAVATAGPAADVPYGAALADKILVQLTPEQRSAFLHRYFHISSGVEQVAADMKGNLSPEDVEALADVLSEVSALMKKTA